MVSGRFALGRMYEHYKSIERGIQMAVLDDDFTRHAALLSVFGAGLLTTPLSPDILYLDRFISFKQE